MADKKYTRDEIFKANGKDYSKYTREGVLAQAEQIKKQKEARQAELAAKGSWAENTVLSSSYMKAMGAGLSGLSEQRQNFGKQAIKSAVSGAYTEKNERKRSWDISADLLGVNTKVDNALLSLTEPEKQKVIIDILDGGEISGNFEADNAARKRLTKQYCASVRRGVQGKSVTDIMALRDTAKKGTDTKTHLDFKAYDDEINYRVPGYEKAKAEYAINGNIDLLKRRVETLDSEQKKLAQQAATAEQEYNRIRFSNPGVTADENAEYTKRVSVAKEKMDAAKSASDKAYENYTTAKTHYEERKASSAYNKKIIENYEKQFAVMNNADFAIKSKADSNVQNETYRGINKLGWSKEQKDFQLRHDDWYAGNLNDSYEDLREALLAEEIGTYNYLYATEGKAAAEDYLDTIKPLTDLRTAQNIGSDGGLLSGLGYTYLGGLEGAVSDFSQAFDALPFREKKDYYFPGVNEIVGSEYIQNASGITKKVYQTSQAVGNMTPAIAIAAIPGGKSTAVKSAVTAASRGVFFTQSFGGAYTQSINSGKSEGESIAYAGITAGLELGSEIAIGGLAGFGKSGVSRLGNAFSKVAPGISSKTGIFVQKGLDAVSKSARGRALINISSKMISNGISEGAEEYFTATVDPLVRNLIYGENNKLTLWSDEQSESFVIGMLTAFVLNSPYDSINTYSVLKSDLDARLYNIEIDSSLSREQKIQAKNELITTSVMHKYYDAAQRFDSFEAAKESITQEGFDKYEVGEEIARAAFVTGRAQVQSEAGLNAIKKRAELGKAKGENINSTVNDILTNDELRIQASSALGMNLHNDKGSITAVRRYLNRVINGEIQSKSLQPLQQTVANMLNNGDSLGHIASTIDLNDGLFHQFAEEFSDNAYKFSASAYDIRLQRYIKDLQNASIAREANEQFPDRESRLNYVKKALEFEKAKDAAYEAGELGISFESLARAYKDFPVDMLKAMYSDGVNDVRMAKEQLGVYEGIEGANAAKKPAETAGEQYNHYYDESSVETEFLQSINSEIEEAIKQIRNGNVDNVPQVILVTELTQEARDRLSEFCGINLDGYSCAIEKDALIHIDKRHGKGGKHDSSLADPKDIARIGYVINNFDGISWVTDDNGNKVYSKKYNSRDNKPSSVIELAKRIDGTFSVSEVIPDTKKKTIWVTSARINKKTDVGSQVPNAAKGNLQQTSETPLDSSSVNNIIPQKAKNVKSEDVKDNNSNSFGEKGVQERDSNKTDVTQNTNAFGNSKKLASEQVKAIKEACVNIYQAKDLFKDNPKLRQGLSRLASAFGIQIKVFNGSALKIQGIDGFYDAKEQTVYINAKGGEKPISAIVRHEIIHVFAQNNSYYFNKLCEFITGRYVETYGKEAYDTWLQNKKDEYAAMGRKLSDSGAKQELCADIGMDMFNDADVVKDFVVKSRTATEKLRQVIHDILNKVYRAFGLSEKLTAMDGMKILSELDSTVSTTSGKVERSHEPYQNNTLPGALAVSDLRAAEQLLLDGISEYDRAKREVIKENGSGIYDDKARLEKLIAQKMGVDTQQKNTGDGDGVMYSIVEPFTDKNGKYFENAVVLDTNFFNGVSPRNWGQKLRQWVNNRAASNPAILPITDENGNVTILQFANPSDKVRKNGGVAHRVLDELSFTPDNISKLAVIHIDEIVSVSEENVPYHTNNNTHGWLDKNGWLHRNANVINSFNGNIYNLTFDIGKAQDGRTILYATKGNIKKVGQTEMNSLKIKGSGSHSNFADSLSQTTPVVNTNSQNESDEKFSSYIPKGENPARDVSVPKTDDKGGKVSYGVRTVLEAKSTPDTYVSPIEEDVKSGKYSHYVITDKAAKRNAINLISSMRDVVDENGNETGKRERVVDAKKYQTMLDATINEFENGELRGKEKVALLQVLYANAANNFEYMSNLDENGVPIIEKLVIAMVRTASNAGQELQAQKLLKKITPAGKLYDLQKFVENTNKEIHNQLGDIEAWVVSENGRIEEQNGKIDEKTGKRLYKTDKESKILRKQSKKKGRTYARKQQDLVLNKDLVNELLAAKNQAEADKAQEKLVIDIARQIKATVKDKVQALRYTFMLFKPLTHLRNIIGNSLFAVEVGIRNTAESILQPMLIRNKADRTKTFALTPEKRRKLKALSKYAEKLFEEQTRYIKGDSSRFDITTNLIDENRIIFKTKPLEWVRKFNSNTLEAEDILFLRHHFVNHYAKALLAKGITVSDIESGNVSSKVLENTMEYAAEQAQKATFRDTSYLANALNKFKNTNVATDIILSSQIPFTKTPINIIKRGVEYSPVSLLEGLGRICIDNINVKKGYQESVNSVKIIETMCEGLTGGALMALGMWALLAGILVIRPGDDDDEENLGESMGHQNYSIEILDHSVTIDWAAPAVMPFFMGAEIAKSMEEKEINALEVLARIPDPVIETSMLSGLFNTLNAIKYSEGGTDIAANIVTEVLSGYTMQFVPSLFNDIAKVSDKYESRSSRPSVNGDIGFLEALYRKIANKIPGVRNAVNSKPYIDIFGKYETKSSPKDYIFSVFQNFLVPGYVNKITSSNVTKEYSDIVIKTDRTDIIPGYVTKINDKKLTHDEYFVYHRERGRLYDVILPYLVEQEWYRNCSDDNKAELLGYLTSALDMLTKKTIAGQEYNLKNVKLTEIFNALYANDEYDEDYEISCLYDVVDIYLYDKYENIEKEGKKESKKVKERKERTSAAEKNAKSQTSVKYDTAFWDAYDKELQRLIDES